MTIIEMMKKLQKYGDITLNTTTKENVVVYDVTVEDFAGFDDDWNEIEREFVDENLVDTFLEALETQALLCEGDFYQVYHFITFQVHLGFTSYDI